MDMGENVEMAGNDHRLQDENFWAVVRSRSYDELEALLIRQGQRPETIGNSLLVSAQKAVDLCEYEAARILLGYLLRGVNDPLRAAPILALTGDLYMREGRYAEAREYYGRLPMTRENLEKCLRTFLPPMDLDGLFKAAAHISATANPAVEQALHEIIGIFFNELGTEAGTRQEHAARYEGNLKLLKKIDPGVPGLLKTLDGSPLQGFPEQAAGHVLNISGDIFAAPNGVWQRLAMRPAGARLTRKALLQNKHFLVRCAALDRFIEFVSACAAGQPEFFKYQCTVVIDFRLLPVFLTVVDLGPLEDCDFVIRFLDESDLEGQFFKNAADRNWMVPETAVFLSDDDGQFIAARLQPLLTEFDKIYLKDIGNYEKQLAELYPPEFPASIPGKIKDKTLKILFKTSRYTTFLQYATRDLADGFKQLGYETLIEMEEEGNAYGIRQDAEMSLFCNFRPDLVICICHLRYEFPWIPANIPFVTWVQDKMDNVFDISDPSLLSTQDYLFITSPLKRNILKKNDVFANCSISILPHMLNPDLYHPVDCEKKYEVSYVAHLNMPEACIAAYSDLPDSGLSDEECFVRYFMRFLDQFSMAELNRIFVGPVEIWQEYYERFCQSYPRANPEVNKNTLVDLFEKLLAIHMRCKILKPLVDNNIPFKIFGRGWDRHPWFKHIAMGSVKNGNDLNKVLNETKINLNVSPCASYHPRVNEAAGAKAFFLTRNIGSYDYIPMNDFFELGKEYIIFNDYVDLLEKIYYYLNHEEEREAMADRIRKKVLQEYTFMKGGEKILKTIMAHLQVQRNNV